MRKRKQGKVRNKPSFNTIARLLSITIFIAVSFSACVNHNYEKPNVILIMSDDQGWGDLKVGGNDTVATPNLNLLAEQGVQFDQFYVDPMCAPTRASLLTGRYCLRTNTTWVGRRTEALSWDETTLANILQANGYATGCFGKWHLGPYTPYTPNERGFDEFYGFLSGALINYYESNLNHNGTRIKSDQYITDLLTDKAIDFIEVNKDKPFFCYIPYNVPHHPYQVPMKYFSKYKDLGVEDDRTACVYGMIDNMDENIGRLLTHVEDLNITEKTVVIFLSDNGPQYFRYNDGLAGKKGQVSEGSVKVPFFIKWKDHFQPGKHVQDISAHIDVLPTILDIAGIPVPDTIQLDGVSLLPLIEGEACRNEDRMIFTHQSVFGKNFMTPGSVRTQKYRLINWEKGYELFDMQADRSQGKNIIRQEPEIAEKLIIAYENWYNGLAVNGFGLPPVPIGYSTVDTVNITAPDALLKGDLLYSDKHGWADDFVVNWKSIKDTLVFPVDVYTKGNYEFRIHYACKDESLGTVFQVKSNNNVIQNEIIVPNDAPLLKLPNITYWFSSKVKEWAILSIGSMELKEGEQDILLQAIVIPGNNAGEIKSLEIIKLNE
ncbi:MAG: arylsulfatase [Bacteroidales bacterium]|jgi:arylsulfatase A-like enzyme|nr:arylsulfatase [Bacteroidales bacterium]